MLQHLQLIKPKKQFYKIDYYLQNCKIKHDKKKKNLDFELITQFGTRGKLYVSWHKNVYIQGKFHPALGNLTKDIVDLLIEPDLKKGIWKWEGSKVSSASDVLEFLL